MHPTVGGSAPGTRLGRVLCRLAALACLVATGTTFAQTWPERPVHLVVPFATGGGPDFSARALAADLAVRLHQQVVVDNRPGGNSVIGALAVARAPADGYTLLFTSGATVSVLPHIAHNLPLDPVRDLVPVAGVAKTPIFLVVHPVFLQMTYAAFSPRPAPTQVRSPMPRRATAPDRIWALRCSSTPPRSTSCTCPTSPLPVRSLICWRHESQA